MRLSRLISNLNCYGVRIVPDVRIVTVVMEGLCLI